MTDLELKIYEIVRNIPKGKVSTYGKIAELAGNKNLSRVVGNIMHKNPAPFLDLAKSVGYSEIPLDFCEDKSFRPVPCHRVVNASGKMGANFGLGGPEIQEKMLAAEGIEIINGKLNLIIYGV